MSVYFIAYKLVIVQKSHILMSLKNACSGLLHGARWGAKPGIHQPADHAKDRPTAKNKFPFQKTKTHSHKKQMKT